jgi:DNA polymerase III subunit gamma/tau
MSQFVVSARKYRPQRFEDVVGQQHIAQTLKNALATDHVAHAFLFCGPRGVGKTTCARILAKILNCQQRTPDFEACNTCASCQSFNENASFNIIELDAASNNSVEHIRALIEQVRFRPQEGQYKVFIIDEVHMLSNQAFNAFLKTLEEPPPYAIFILATTEKHKIIPTILSRCQIFDFRRITVGDMVLHLQNICRQEGIDAEEDALHIVGQKADGALRDALSIFDRITSFSGKNIRYADVIENLNVLDYDYYFQITDALLAEDLATLLNLFDQIVRKGFEADIFINGLAEHLRNVLVCKDPATLALLETGDSLRERYQRQAQLAPSSFILTALNLCNDCDINYKMARHKRLHVEMALIKMCRINSAIAAAQSGAVEKKTPDRSVTPQTTAQTTAQPPVSSPQSTAPTPVAPPPPPVQEPATGHHSGNAAALSKDAASTLAAQLKLGTKTADKFSLSLDHFDKAVKVEQAEIAQRESLFSLANTQKAWGEYAHRTESPSLRQAFNVAKLSIDDTTVVATVGLSIQAGLLKDEMSKIMDYLRYQMQDMAIKLKVVFDESLMPTVEVPKPVRPLSTREKLERMKSENPAVADFLTRFDMRESEG